jgi:AcrR family transcriptional regulator
VAEVIRSADQVRAVRAERGSLSQERIVRAALALIDERGLGALSMRRLGARLGVEAMSLYNHLPSKEAILDGVRALLLEEAVAAGAPSATGSDWRDALIDTARALRRLWRAHPRAFPLFSGGVERAYVVARELSEQTLARLTAAGFSAREAIFAYRSVARYALGFCLVDAAGQEQPHALTEEEQGSLQGSPLLAQLIDEIAADSGDALFERGLTALLDGLAAGGG